MIVIFNKILILGNIFSRNRIIVYSKQKLDISDLETRLYYYLEDRNKCKVTHISTLFTIKIINLNHLLLFGNEKFNNILKYRKRTFYVDHRYNYSDAWQWIFFSNSFHNYIVPTQLSKIKFIEQTNKLKSSNYKKTYVFGTGPSLEKALSHDWSDGYRIVCNTIVRDKELWNHISPHFIIAGDAIYHFGFTNFAKTFRQDLFNRMSETDTYFIYPSMFHRIVIKEFLCYSNRLIPMPEKSINGLIIDFNIEFCLPNKGNVLNLMLPISCFLAKTTYLWGFDGRSPTDKFFWSNSVKHSYPEYMNELIINHPKFFDYYVPKSNPMKYINEVHGSNLDSDLIEAEAKGWSFVMLHKTWTEILQKRHLKI